MDIKKVNILGEKAFDVFIDKPSDEMESLLRTHLKYVGKGPKDTIVFVEDDIHILNDKLKNKGIPKVKIVKEEKPIKEYKDLGKKGAGQPQKPDHFWLYSYTAWFFDTPSGQLEVGTYAIEPSGRAIIKISEDKTIDRKSESDVMSEFNVIL